MHPGDLLNSKHEHGVVIRVIHIVHKHVAVWPIGAGNMRKHGLAKIRPGGVWSVVNHICSATVFCIAPDMSEIKEVADLVSSGASKIKRGGGSSACTKCFVHNNYAIGRSGSPGKLSVTE